MQMLPILVFAIIVAGAVQHLLPSELISKWIGTASGIRGILIGTCVGCFTPGGPYISLPIAAGLLRAGASVGTMVAFMTAWSLMEFSRLSMEIGIMGWKFSLIRVSCSFFFAPISGSGCAESAFPPPSRSGRSRRPCPARSATLLRRPSCPR